MLNGGSEVQSHSYLQPAPSDWTYQLIKVVDK